MEPLWIDLCIEVIIWCVLVESFCGRNWFMLNSVLKLVVLALNCISCCRQYLYIIFGQKLILQQCSLVQKFQHQIKSLAIGFIRSCFMPYIHRSFCSRCYTNLMPRYHRNSLGVFGSVEPAHLIFLPWINTIN